MKSQSHPVLAAALAALFALASGLAACGASRLPASAAGVARRLKGDWTAKLIPGSTHVNVKLLRPTEGRNIPLNTGLEVDVPQGSFEGWARAETGTAPARFKLTNSAGTLRGEGRFERGEGRGTFTFDTDPAYVAELKSLGYGNLTDDQLLALAVNDVSAGFIRELGARGYAGLAPGELTEMKMRGVDAGFISEVERLGYARLTTRQLLGLAYGGVTPDFIRAAHAKGYKNLTVSQLIELRARGPLR